jgi:FKBP-type peptidyl-prolyl cis-trans isomerase SlyD
MINKKDFIEIRYTGYANKSIFDSNIEEDLKKISEKQTAKKLIICVGEGRVISGLDKAFEKKEIGKEYLVKIDSKEGFGERKRDLIKVVPLKLFKDKNARPIPGMVYLFDNSVAKVIAVNGGRVSMDFNNPLSGKEIEYKFTIVKKVEDEKEKVESLFEGLFKMLPEYEIKDNILVKGEKNMEIFCKVFSPKFKELLGKELSFEEKKQKEIENNNA